MSLLIRGDRVLVRMDKAEDKTEGGLYLPEKAQKRPGIGTVEGVGPGDWRECQYVELVDIKVGDRVLCTKFSGHQLTDDEDLLVFRQADIIAIVEENGA